MPFLFRQHPIRSLPHRTLTAVMVVGGVMACSSTDDAPLSSPGPVHAGGMVGQDTNNSGGSATGGVALGTGASGGAAGGGAMDTGGVGGSACPSAPNPGTPCNAAECNTSGPCACSGGVWRCGGTVGGAPNASGGNGSGGTLDAGGGSGGMPEETGDLPVYDYGTSVENTGADCEVPELPAAASLPTVEKLPDPFTKIDGTRVAKQSEWRCRRQEIHKQAEAYVYGEKPPKPDLVSGTVSNTNISVDIEHGGKQVSFNAKVVLPASGTAPYPAIISLGTGGISLGESRVLDEGVAIIYYNHYDLGKEGAAEASRGLDNPGLFYDLYGGDHSAGLLMSWAWGASRLMDVLQEADGSIIDSTAVGVTGCSRNGKGAFAAGVFDERIALTIPHETSMAGVPSYRVVDQRNQDGTERTDYNYFGLNWFSDNFEPFIFDKNSNTVNAVKLPIDTHELVAMVAPRGLLVLDNSHEVQMVAFGGHAGAVGGAEVYEALGVRENVSYHSNVSNTGHCRYKDEYTELLLKNINKFLKHSDDVTGEFNVGAGASTDLAEWRDWTTPTLEDDAPTN